MEGTIAEIRMFAGNFPPRGWFFCNGQLLSIAQWTAFFSLVGTTYGGDGQVTFALPDLRGRVADGTGQGPGLANVDLGEQSGTPNVTLLPTNMPAHNHAFTNGSAIVPCSTGAGNVDSPAGSIRAGSATDENYAAPGAANGNMNPLAVSGTIGVAGNSAPFSIMQPYLGMNYIVCAEGIYPSRN